jgi:hypothetical protein
MHPLAGPLPSDGTWGDPRFLKLRAKPLILKGGISFNLQGATIRMKRVRDYVPLLTLIVLGFCVIAEVAPRQSKAAQEQPGKFKRLILIDGSCESISQYTVQGDRVRYFSTERNSWEELPYSLVDWAATDKYARQAAQESSERMNKALEKASKERNEEEARTPLVAPGVRLPSPDGVFLLDVYKSKQELNSLAQNGADLRKNTGSNILKGIINPIASSRQTVELEGLHARVQSHISAPVIYFAVDAADPLTGYNSETAKDHLRVVRCEENKGNRIVFAYSIAVYGKVKQQAQYIESQIEPVSDYWVKVTPVAPLQPGEYALIELDDKGSMNEFVWDFGVDPAAPPNPAVVLADPGRKEPVLMQKSRNKAKTNP